MEELTKLRKKIDIIDDELLAVVKKRLKVVTQIGRLKKKLKLSPLQQQRWNTVINSRMKKAERIGMNKEFIRSLFELIHHESLQKQNDILKK